MYPPATARSCGTATAAHLATLMRNTIRLRAQGDMTFARLTRSTSLQREAFALLGVTMPLHLK